MVDLVATEGGQPNETERLRTALENCIDYWPSALNDDLQERTYQEGSALLEELTKEVRITEASGNAPKRLITHKDVVGQLARWAVQQHPYGAPEGLFELGAKIAEVAQSWEIGPPSLKMREFAGWLEFERWLADVLLDHPILKAWNTPRSGHDAPFVAVSRYWSVKPEHDFIDIDALLRNVSRSVWATSFSD